MIDRDRLLDVAFDFAQRLICEAPQPEYPSERDARCHALIELETNDVRPGDGRRVAAEHALNALTSPGLVPQEMQRRSRHTVADQLVGDVAGVRRKAAELARERQRLPKFGMIGAISPERPKRGELIVGIPALPREP